MVALGRSSLGVSMYCCFASCCVQVLYLVGLPFPLRWAFRACIQLLHQHTRRKIRMCRATDVPRRLPSQLRSHKLSLAAGLDALAYLETQSYIGDVALDSGAYFAEAAAAAGLDATSGAGGSVVGSELGPDPFTPRTPHSGKVRGPGPLRRFRWRRMPRTAKDAAGAGTGVGVGSRQRLRVRLVKHGVFVLCGITVLMLCYLLVLRQFLPSGAQLSIQRVAAVLQGVP
jgi:hypothetical protein